jgi:mannose-1-phosphate guanylyltransferase/mannose-6-phosphate isomerase
LPSSITITPLILCGGEGSRLQPLSSPEKPKPFLKLFKGKSLLQLTAERLGGEGFDLPVISCRAAHVTMVDEQLADCGLRPQLIIAEPEGRNTGPAVAAATMILEKRNKGRLILAAPADHWVEKVEDLKQALKEGCRFSEGAIVLFGITPSGPDSRYGYMVVQPGGRVKTFVEKPELGKARQLIKEGAWWNSGMFLFSCKQGLALMEKAAPSLLKTIRQVTENLNPADRLIHLSQSYRSTPSMPFDRAVVEKVKERCMVPLRCGWCDVGDWPSLLATLEKEGGLGSNEDSQRLAAILNQRLHIA